MIRAALPLCLAFALSLSAASAQDDGERSEIEDGAGLLGEGAKLLMQGLLDELGPKMRDLAEAMREWDLESLDIDDLSNYHAPEVLPNGDIIIRRKDPNEFDVPPFERDPDSEIEI